MLSWRESADTIADVARRLVTDERVLLVFTVSTYHPTDHTHRFTGAQDTFAVRTNGLIASLERLSRELGLAIVDVDGALAELGAAANVPAPGRWSDAATQFVTEEAVAAIDDMHVLGGSLQAPIMRIPVPAFDRRTNTGTMLSWHVTPGALVKSGDPLYTVRFDSLIRASFGEDDDSPKRVLKRQQAKRAKSKEAITVSVVAASDAVLHEILIPEGARVAVGDVSAIATTEPLREYVDAERVQASFRVGVRVAEQ